MAELLEVDLTTSAASKKLIAEVKKYPILYDEKSDGYRENEVKAEIWERIAANIVGIKSFQAVDLVKNRWRNLRWACKKSYVAYKEKRQRGVNVRPFRFAKEMSFLVPHYRKNKLIQKGLNLSDWTNQVLEKDAIADVPESNHPFGEIDVASLLQAIKKNPIILDGKRRAGKSQAWKKVTMEMSGSATNDKVMILKHTWDDVLRIYLKAVEDHKAKLEKGLTGEPPPAFYEDMLFIVNSGIKSANISDNVVLSSEGDDDNGDPLEQNDYEIEDIVRCKQEVEDNNDHTKDEALNYAQNNAEEQIYMENIRMSDDMDSYFLQMARMVKKMKRVNQILIKKTMMNIVLDMELREARDN